MPQGPIKNHADFIWSVAVRYKLSIDKYIRDKGYADIASLVAFSGKIDDGTGASLTGADTNGSPSRGRPRSSVVPITVS